MEHKLRALALLLALLDPQLHLFQDWFKGNETLQLEGYNSTQIKLYTTSYSPWRPPEILFPMAPQKLHSH